VGRAARDCCWRNMIHSFGSRAKTDGRWTSRADAEQTRPEEGRPWNFRQQTARARN